MEILTGIALGLLINIFFIVAKDFHRQSVARVFLLLLFSATAFLLIPCVPEQYQHGLEIIQTSVPALFWLLCQFAFNDKPYINRIWSIVAIYSVLAPAIATSIWSINEMVGIKLVLGKKLGECFEYALIVHGLWMIVYNWPNDLVESRRKLRAIMLIVVGFSVASAVIMLNFELDGIYTRSIIVSTAAFIFSLFFLKGHEGGLFLKSHGQAITVFVDKKAVNDEIVLKAESHQRNNPLKNIMDKGYYRTENLTLRMLSKEINLPEYKTRHLINQVLGYRNFNDYINQLRINDAVERLINDPDEPILNISLDVGYRSISSFNRAFKDIMGVSPTLYREKTLPKNENLLLKK